MVHPKTKQVVIVGGSATGSLVGGAIGYQIEKSNNLKQVQKLKSEGFVIQDVSN
jgi:phage tail tape-measure protein